MYGNNYQQSQQSTQTKIDSFIKRNEKIVINAFVFVMGLLGIGIIARFVKKDDEYNGIETVQERYNEKLDITAEPLEETVKETVGEPLDERHEAANKPLETIDTEETEKERIRQAMSLLGKRSGAARRAKKQERKGL